MLQGCDMVTGLPPHPRVLIYVNMAGRKEGLQGKRPGRGYFGEGGR